MVFAHVEGIGSYEIIRLFVDFLTESRPSRLDLCTALKGPPSVSVLLDAGEPHVSATLIPKLDRLPWGRWLLNVCDKAGGP